MIFYLDKALQPYFTQQTSLFDQVMALRGEIYRHLDGRLTQRIQLGNQSYFIKQHRGIGWKEIFKNVLQGRLPIVSAKNEWLAIGSLQQLGIATPRVMGYGLRGYNLAAQESFILMEALTPTLSLEEIVKTWQWRPPTFKQKLRLLKAVADIARILHVNGINHRDFYICHFLIDKDYLVKEDAPLYLIDLHRAQIRKRTPKRWIIKDLAGLYFSSKDSCLTKHDRYRFMKYYSAKSLQESIRKDHDFWQQVKMRGDKLYSDHHHG